MKLYLIKIILFQLLYPMFYFTSAQIYKVDYKSPSFKIFASKTPIIAILEEDSGKVKLFNGLALLKNFTEKFTVYSTENLKENKEILNIKEFNPDDKKFLQPLNKQLSIEYLLTWKNIDDPNEVYQLTIYSTKSFKKIYDNKFIYTINSNPILDVNKLLVENLEPAYYIISGNLLTDAKPIDTIFKLYKDNELIKEWTGNEKIMLAEGIYRLISEADGYLKDERRIELPKEKEILIDIDLLKDLSILPQMHTSNNDITGLQLKLEDDLLKILYNLEGDKENKYKIKLFLIEKSSQKNIEPNSASGDLGSDIIPDSNKVIVWNYIKDIGQYSNLKNYDLQLSAETKGGIAWYYYVGGAVLVGGTTAALLLNKKDDGNTTKTMIGEPPVRP
jgi:hypothetical protein